MPHKSTAMPHSTPLPTFVAAEAFQGRGYYGKGKARLVLLQSMPPPLLKRMAGCALLKFREAGDGLEDVMLGAMDAASRTVEAAGWTVSALKEQQMRVPGTTLDERLHQALRAVSGGGLSVLEIEEKAWSGGDRADEEELERLCAIITELGHVKSALEKQRSELEQILERLRHSLCDAHAAEASLRQAMGRGRAHVQGIKAHGDKQLLKHWSRANETLPEYRLAADLICLRREWMCSTLLGRHVAEICGGLGEDMKAFEYSDRVRDTLVELIRKAYRSEDRWSAMQQRDLVSGEKVHQKVYEVYQSLEQWKKPLFGVAIKVMLDYEEDGTAIMSKLAEVVDHALHCQQVKVKGFQVVMSHSARLLQRTLRQGAASDKAGDLEDLNEALIRFYSCFEDFLDDHKERAFSASFVEPALFYWSHSDQGWHLADNTVPHAVNWFLALLNAALGTHLPLIANYSDECMHFVGDFWLGLKDECWEHFADPQYFGRGWQAIPPLKQGGRSLIRKKVRPGYLPHEQTRGPVPAKVFANSAVDPDGDPGVRRALSLYLERFAHFFSRGFFVRRAFEVLNAENKPEHAGFRKACATIYAAYRREHAGVTEETLEEHVYPDDPYFMKLDVGRTEQFFAWLRVLKAPEPNVDPERREEEGAACSCRARFLYGDRDAAVASLVEMGFEEEQAERAWLACLGSSEAAVGVLTGSGPPPLGLPPGEEPPVPPAAGGAPQQCPQQ